MFIWDGRFPLQEGISRFLPWSQDIEWLCRLLAHIACWHLCHGNVIDETLSTCSSCNTISPFNPLVVWQKPSLTFSYIYRQIRSGISIVDLGIVFFLLLCICICYMQPFSGIAGKQFLNIKISVSVVFCQFFPFGSVSTWTLLLLIGLYLHLFLHLFAEVVAFFFSLTPV